MISKPGNQPDGIERERDSSEASAPWGRIAFAATENWVEEISYDDNIVPKEGAHQTYLLWARQTDADRGKTFHATAVRLETALAVQNQSQWCINLDPRFHHLTLHWLRVVRNKGRIDQLRRDRMRLIQRETQLEHQVIDGGWTLLVVLDDVRPGDSIEAAYTFASRHPISFGWSETFFTVPAQVVVGCYRLSVIFDSTRRAMRWKGSDDAPAHQANVTDEGRTKWIWEGSQTTLRDNEPNSPSSYLNFIWLQVSDVPDWNHLAQRFSEAWNGASDDGAPDLLAEFASPAEVNAAAVTALIRQIQDGFRYLSIDLETGGWVPATPAVTARQRRGDCKDLVWLAFAILKSWGVEARPVLVGTGLCGRVASVLPMTALFNHAVLEVRIGGAARWFDLTLRSQGGDFFSQPVKWFEFGMPVDPAIKAPEAQPGAQATNLLAVREAIYLDTRRGESSAVEVLLRAEGPQAEFFRRTRLAQGPEGFANERLKTAQRRYNKAKRMGALQLRDDRDANVFELAETFEISDVVYPGERGERALFDVPPNIVLQTFALPEDKPRRCPWAMPFPFEVRHSLTLKAANMPANKTVRRKWSAIEFIAMVEERRLSGEWTKTVHFIVGKPEIGTEKLSAYRRQLADFFRATTWRMYMSWGHRRQDLAAGFGQLPSGNSNIAAYIPADDPMQYPEAEIGADNQSSPFYPLGKSPRSRFGRLATRRSYFLIAWGAVVLISAFSRSCSYEPYVPLRPFAPRSPSNSFYVPQRNSGLNPGTNMTTDPFSQDSLLFSNRGDGQIVFTRNPGFGAANGLPVAGSSVRGKLGTDEIKPASPKSGPNPSSVSIQDANLEPTPTAK